MKKINCLLLGVAAISTLGISSCKPKESIADIALITDIGNIDDHSFNQGTWEGVVEFCKNKNYKSQYYRPSEDTDEARKAMMKQAILDGAKVIVLPGFLFETACYDMQTEYPDIKFLLIDGQPHTPDYKTFNTTANTTNILFKEEQPGYLAGYAAVREGFTKIGFLGGMAVPAVVRYGFGYVQGANDAAKELNKKIEIKYGYTGGFVATDTVQSNAANWYSQGTEVIFSCGGSIYTSIVKAAESSKGKVIGVDVDQALDSNLIITSAKKELTSSVVDSLTKLEENGGILTGKWPDALSGKTRTLGAKEEMISLAHTESSWRLKNFSIDEYKVLFNKLKEGKIVVNDNSNNDIKPTVDENLVSVDYNAYAG